MRIDIPKIFEIRKVLQENPTMVTLIFDCNFNVKPGQFVNMWIPRVDEKPFSVAYADGKELHLTIADVGPFSHAAVELKIGSKIGLRGPYGQAFTWRKNQKIAMIGGGFGSAPLHFTALHAVEDGCEIDFIIGARREDLLIYTERVEQLEGANLHISTDDGSVGHKGYNVQILERLIEEGNKYDMLMTCGPEVMMKAVVAIANKNNLNAQISLERYMKCGFGLCGNCVVDPTGDPTCTKGPVVPLSYINSLNDIEFGKYHRDALGKKRNW
jgi:dihydroorotate dehydrogenase electron transfer subunit